MKEADGADNYTTGLEHNKAYNLAAYSTICCILRLAGLISEYEESNTALTEWRGLSEIRQLISLDSTAGSNLNTLILKLLIDVFPSTFDPHYALQPDICEYHGIEIEYERIKANYVFLGFMASEIFSEIFEAISDRPEKKMAIAAASMSMYNRLQAILEISDKYTLIFLIVQQHVFDNVMHYIEAGLTETSAKATPQIANAQRESAPLNESTLSLFKKLSSMATMQITLAVNINLHADDEDGVSILKNASQFCEMMRAQEPKEVGVSHKPHYKKLIM